MKDEISVFLAAQVEIAPVQSFDECAKLLNAVLNGFDLRVDNDCRFDEYPAFIADALGVELVLFGIPLTDEIEAHDRSEHYVLRLSSHVKLPVLNWRAVAVGTFLTQILPLNALSPAHRVDLSGELADYLMRCGFKGCIAAIQA